MVKPTAKNWIAISPSRYPWEQEALDFIHDKFPVSPDYLAWSNFEFIASDGSINECDLLIASPWGVFLIEIKSTPGRMVHHELVAYILASRGSVAEESQRALLASAAVRAAIEAEHISENPRFEEYRSGDKIFVALHSDLRDYAVLLGREADRLALIDPLPTPARVLEELRGIKFPDAVADLSSPVEARFSERYKRAELWEEAISLGYSGRALTLLSWKNAASDYDL